MCGLWASVGFEPDPERIDIVRHRGPDGRGFEIFQSAAGPVALGHRRLAIIDRTATGLQPMADPSGRYRILLNGEIYNHVELRRELEMKGCRFRGMSDTEVLLHAFIVWGQDSLNRLRGMFAFLLWDNDAKRLFAFRDRYGIKPLYFVQANDRIAFASEIKQLIGLPGLTGRINVARAYDYLTQGLIDHTDETLFDGVRQLEPGSSALVEIDGSRPRLSLRRWYPWRVPEPIELDEREAADRFRMLLDEAVRLHLRADVPIGSCLSGGLDSSSIVCLAAAQLRSCNIRLDTVTAGYDQPEVDERRYAQIIADTCQTQHHLVTPRADDVLQRASEIIWHQDEPFGSTSVIAQWCVFGEARRIGVKVMLDGQGADEMLAGYHFSFGVRMAELLRSRRIGTLLCMLAERRRIHGSFTSGSVKSMFGALLYEPLAARLKLAWRERTFGGSLNFDMVRNDAGENMRRRHALPRPNTLGALCLNLTYGANLQMLLHWEDRNSMAHSVEARLPFLDHPLVEFALALGSEHKIVGAETKRVLRQAVAGVVPDRVRNRTDKLGFATPEQTWFRGPLAGFLREGVEMTLAAFPDLLVPRAARAFAEDVIAGRRSATSALWRFVNLGIWSRRFRVGA
jgi:asparagine synthase (glutamine-hydrolysing)